MWTYIDPIDHNSIGLKTVIAISVLSNLLVNRSAGQPSASGQLFRNIVQNHARQMAQADPGGALANLRAL